MKREPVTEKELGVFKVLPKAELERLIAKGREDAAALDESLRPQFEMSAADAALRLPRTEVCPLQASVKDFAD